MTAMLAAGTKRTGHDLCLVYRHVLLAYDLLEVAMRHDHDA